MRDFRRKPGRIGALPIGARLLYSIWLAYALVALIVAAQLYQDGPTLDPDRVVTYYTGVDPAAEAATPDPGDGPALELPGGPALDLPPDGPALDLPTGGPALDLPTGGVADIAAHTPESAVAPGQRIAVEYNARRLLEVTHGHLFMMPLFYLVIAHIFVLVGLRPWLNAAFVVTGALSVGAHIAAPWLVRESASWAFLMPLSGVAMLISLGGMATIGLVAMWLPGGRQKRSAA